MGQDNVFPIYMEQAIIELAASMSLIDRMKKEDFLKTVFDKEMLPIKHYPESRIYACVIPVKVRRAAKFSIPNRVTGNSREVVIDKLFELFMKGPIGSEQETLTTLFQEFIDNRKKDPDFAAHTVRKNQCDWNTFFKDTPIAMTSVSRLKPADLMAHFKEMTAGRKMTRHAFGNAKGLLNQLFDLAYEKNLIERNICRELSTRSLKFKPEGSKQDLIYSSDERRLIVEELKGSDKAYDKAMIVQFCLGCRITHVKRLS